MGFRVKRMALLVCAMWLALCAGAQAKPTEAPPQSRALLIGVDEFVSRPSAYPSSTNNVYAMQSLFQSAQVPFERIILPSDPVTDAAALQSLIQATFGGADAGDVSYLYLSTHGEYEPQSGQPPRLLLSDGFSENGITPKQLEAAFDGIEGTKVIILDACNSGAFIGKGMSSQPEEIAFLGPDFKVLTSSGALEESWYWSSGEGESRPQGAFYFTQALTESLSAGAGYPADQNRDGQVTLSELYANLRLNHAASTPQVYPQNDDFVVFSYDVDEPAPTGLERSPIVDVTFSGSTLSRENHQIAVDFIATRPVRVAYQVVYQRDGKWEFENAQLIYDGAERFAAFGDEPGAVSAGHKSRFINLSRSVGDSHGYALLQLVSIAEGGKLTVHAGRVLAILPEGDEGNLTAQVSERLSLSSGRELSIFIGHDVPCTLSIAIVDENETVVHRLCHRQTTRPMDSVFYWDGRLKDGTFAAPGRYRVRAQMHLNHSTVTVLSTPFWIEE